MSPFATASTAPIVDRDISAVAAKAADDVPAGVGGAGEGDQRHVGVVDQRLAGLVDRVILARFDGYFEGAPKNSGIVIICPMRSATSSTRSVMITSSLFPRTSLAC